MNDDTTLRTNITLISQMLMYKCTYQIKILTSISPERTSKSESRLCPSLKSSNKSLTFRPA